MWPFKKKPIKKIDYTKLSEGLNLLHQAAFDLGSSADDVAKHVQCSSSEDFDRRLKNIIHILSDSVIVIDMSHTISIVNTAAEQTFGYEKNELNGKNLSVLMPSVHAERHSGYVNSYVHKNPEAEQYSSKIVGQIREIRGKKKNGELFPIELSITELVRPNGQIIFMGVIRDISKHKQHEELLKARKKYYQTILDTLPINIFIKDKDGRYGFINNKFKESFKKSDGEIIGFKDESLWSKTLASIAIEEDNIVRITQQNYYTERKIKNKHFYIGKSLITDDTTDSIVGFSIDITDMKNAEQTIEEQRIKIKAIFDNSPFGMCSLNESGRIIEINKKLVRLLGYDNKRELIGTNIIDYADLGQEPEILELLDNAEEDCFAQKDLILKNKNNESIYLKITANLLDDDMTANFIITCDDITQDKVKDDQLKILSSAINAASDLIIITDINSNIVFVNDAFLDFYGYTRTEVIGKNPHILNSGLHDKQFFDDMYSKISKGDIWVGNIKNKKKDGTITEDFMTINSIKNFNGQNSFYLAIKRSPK